MHVFAGLCTGKVTLSYWILQNTWQNVQEIDAAKMHRCNFKKRWVPDWSKNKGDKCCAVELANNAGHLNSYNSDQNSIIFFSVHVIQSVIQWGKNPVVLVKRQDDNVKRSNPQNPKEESKSSTKRKWRQDAKEDRALVKKPKEDNTIAVRTDRQQSELRTLNAGTVH